MIEKIEKACAYIQEAENLPSLEDVARHIGLSPSGLQRLFSEKMGISPRSFGDAVRQKKLREALKSGEAVTSALYGSGFGSSSRLYEFAKLHLGMTPRNYQRGGEGKLIQYTVVNSSLGALILGATENGLCLVRLGEDKNKLERELLSEFPKAEIIQADKNLQAWAEALVNYLDGSAPWPLLPYDLRATAFQRKVWEWLRTIPSGETYNYADVAEAIGAPKAARAVARACASNPVALIIPCHRIVPKSGGVGGYRWNPKRKEKLLALEKGKK